MSIDRSEPPCDTRPWRGPHFSVPAFINGCPVIAGLRVPMGEPELPLFVVIYVDNGKQGGRQDDLVVAAVEHGTGYRVFAAVFGYRTYAAAYQKMITQTETMARLAAMGLDTAALEPGQDPS